ncbi:hypothetical protein SUGI_1053580 [Cryptomeria japonica]|uniref:uncharacterized protein LOC131079639 n=1 Tax=Cryptomeria japonica TaxID=3369 RepID=UPI0024146B1F|nr:uncharacterized protein LOC131079639 [Cryptomeria japonica]GLJ49661.1 hypothetical protein SUGI_1053580 [Cryptomeria japonica]
MAQRKGSKRVEVGDDEAVVPLQAVLLADSFAQKFRPITMERPKVLLPLVNVPMIDYTLEWLASAGVEEVFVFCCAHAKQVTSYIENSVWQAQRNLTVTTIESHDCVSVGDALRFIDQRNVVRGDFVLVSGDTVSNMSLKQVLQEHKERRKKDKLAVMTMVVKRTKPSSVTHQNRLGNDELLLAVDSETRQLLYYEDKKDSGKANEFTENIILDRSIVADRPAVKLCNDLQDCFIDICSPEVLMLFTDNFDYQQLRHDFVKALLCDEVMGYKIFTHEIHSEYAARIDNFRAYDAVSKDILQRWTYPLVPDILFSSNGPPIRVDRQEYYKAAGVVQSRSAIVGGTTMLGEGTIIGDYCTITDSVIGKGCTIGCNVIVEGCYIWNNVTIQDNAILKYAIVCDGAVIRAGAVLEPGAILSFRVVIGQNFTVSAYSKISLISQPTEEDSDEELEYAEAASGATESPKNPLSVEENGMHGQNGQLDDESIDAQHWDVSQVGVSGAGCKWSVMEGKEEEEWRHSIAVIPAGKIQELVLKDKIDYEDTVLDIGAGKTSSKPDSESIDEEYEKPDKLADDFDKEVEATFRRIVLEVPGVQQDHVILEVNALRLAENMSFTDCAGGLFRAIMNVALEAPHTSQVELIINTKSVTTKWKDLLRHYLKSEDDEIEVLLKFEEICLESGKEFAPVFSKVLEILYDNDIVSEGAICKWASEKEEADELDKVFVKQSEAFISWLQEASEEEDEEEA